MSCSFEMLQFCFAILEIAFFKPSPYFFNRISFYFYGLCLETRRNVAENGVALKCCRDLIS